MCQLCPNSLEETEGEGTVAQHDAGLHGRNRVGADRPLGFRKLDSRQARRPRRERLEPDLETGRDRSADVTAVASDAVERGGSPEIDDDSWGSVQSRDRQAVHQPVRAYFRGSFGSDRDRHDRGARREQRQAASLGHRLHAAGQGRNHRRQRDSGDVGQRRAVEVEQPVDEHLQFVGRAGQPGRGPAAGHDSLAVDQSEGHIGVTDVEHEQHGAMIPPRRDGQLQRLGHRPAQRRRQISSRVPGQSFLLRDWRGPLGRRIRGRSTYLTPRPWPRNVTAQETPDRLSRRVPLRYHPPVRQRRPNPSPPLPQEEWCRPCRQRSSS